MGDGAKPNFARLSVLIEQDDGSVCYNPVVSHLGVSYDEFSDGCMSICGRHAGSIVIRRELSRALSPRASFWAGLRRCVLWNGRGFLFGYFLVTRFVCPGLLFEPITCLPRRNAGAGPRVQQLAPPASAATPSPRLSPTARCTAVAYSSPHRSQCGWRAPLFDGATGGFCASQDGFGAQARRLAHHPCEHGGLYRCSISC